LVISQFIPHGRDERKKEKEKRKEKKEDGEKVVGPDFH
jgi:hypothetical protein